MAAWQFDFDDEDGGLPRAVVAAAHTLPQHHRRALHLPVRAERHWRHGVPRRRLVSAHVHGAAAWQGRRVLLQLRRRRLRSHGLGQRTKLAGRTRAAHVGFAFDVTDRSEARRERRHGAGLGSRDRPDHPARQAGLAAEVRGHLLHAHDRPLAAGVDRGRGRRCVSRAADDARRRSVARCAIDAAPQRRGGRRRCGCAGDRRFEGDDRRRGGEADARRRQRVAHAWRPSSGCGARSGRCSTTSRWS